MQTALIVLLVAAGVISIVAIYLRYKLKRALDPKRLEGFLSEFAKGASIPMKDDRWD